MIRPITRNAAREEFLGDLITAAIEGGIGYWSQTSQYQYMYDGELKACIGQLVADCAETRATIHVVSDDDEGYENEGLTLDYEAVERGLKLIREGGCGIHARTRNRLLVADRASDAITLDAFDADTVIQLGLLGELVYG